MTFGTILSAETVAISRQKLCLYKMFYKIIIFYLAEDWSHEDTEPNSDKDHDMSQSLLPENQNKIINISYINEYE
jgi:hypothetical protein